MQVDQIGRSSHLRQIVHILVSVQIVGWAFVLVIAGLAPTESFTLETSRGHLFLGLISMLLCFIPALRMSHIYAKQPLAFTLALLPLIVLVGLTTINQFQSSF